MEVYVGKQLPSSFCVDTLNIALVPRHCEPIQVTKRNVTMNNFSTSIELAGKLLNQYQLTTLGTLRKNKKRILPFLFI